MSEKIFAEGILFKRPRDGAPDFVKGSISIKVADIGPFLTKYEKNGWVNLDLKESKLGKLYLELNVWDKKEKVEVKTEDKIEYPTGPIED